MTKIIEIKEIKGLFTNADLEDIPENYAVELKNLRPVSGKLVKTFGFGNKIATAFTYQGQKNIFTYIHGELNGDKLYFGVRSGIGDLLRIQAWTGAAWVELITNWSGITNFQSLTGTEFYRTYPGVHCPVFQVEDILRILPGNVGELSGNEAKGLWVGYIDRDIFDEIYTITAGFYGYPTNIDAPALTFTPTQLTGGTFGEYDADAETYGGGTRHYKFSYIYDGVQESLLSDVLDVNFGISKYLQVDFSIVKADHNKRITGMNVYRDNNAEIEDENEVYKKIHTIDFLRESGEYTTGSIAYNGKYYYYIPGLSTFNFNAAKTYKIALYTVAYMIREIDDPLGGSLNGTGNVLFKMATGGAALTTEDWNAPWFLLEDDVDIGIDGDDSCYTGTNTIIISDDNLETNSLGGGAIYFDAGGYLQILQIKNNVIKAVNTVGSLLQTSYNSKVWKILKVSNGLYYVVENGNDVDYTFFDTNLTHAEEYPLSGEVSIKVNGKFAKIIGGRMWKFNIVLDPGGKNEVHEDWAAFSELGQYDVFPASNVVRIVDREGGPGTGIAEVFGNPVFLKPQAIVTLNTKYYPDEPARWGIMESQHNIGNIAEQGYVEAMGNLVICGYDGIYKLSPNNLAETDATPTERLRISEPINDIYEALSQAEKEAVIAEFDQYNGEVVFQFST